MEHNALIDKKSCMLQLQQITAQIAKNCENAPWVSEKHEVYFTYL